MVYYSYYQFLDSEQSEERIDFYNGMIMFLGTHFWVGSRISSIFTYDTSKDK